MMIHQQPPPPKPLLPHMIQSPHIKFPVTGTGSDAVAFPAAPEPASVPVSALYYVGWADLVPPAGKILLNFTCI